MMKLTKANQDRFDDALDRLYQSQDVFGFNRALAALIRSQTSDAQIAAIKQAGIEAGKRYVEKHTA